MTAESLNEALRQTPFVPLRIVTSSGESYEVRHPDAALLTKHNVVLAIPEAAETFAENFRVVSLMHVTAVEPLAAA